MINTGRFIVPFLAYDDSRFFTLELQVISCFYSSTP